MTLVKFENEIVAEVLNAKKRVYTFSLRKKADEKNYLLVISEKSKDIKNKDYTSNKIRIYDESLDSFFEKILLMKKSLENERNKK